jgi:hypothetical protein
MSNPQPQHSNEEPQPPSGRYRYRGLTPMDPDEGLHPEIQYPGVGGGSAPNTPEDLINMQETSAKPSRPDKPPKNHKNTLKAKQALDFLETLELSPAEDKQVALSILRHLESYHDDEVEQLIESTDSNRSQVAAWAVDADRLMLCRSILEGVEL